MRLSHACGQEAERLAAEAAAEEEARKEAQRLRMAEIEAAKAEEARRKAEEEAAMAAEDDERRKAKRAEREAAEAVEAAERAAAEAEAAERAAAEAAAAAARAEDLRRWEAAVKRLVDHGEAVLSDAAVAMPMASIAAESLECLEEGEPGLADAGAVIGCGEGAGTLAVLAATEASAPGGLTTGMAESEFGGVAGTLADAVHTHIGGGGVAEDVRGIALAGLVDCQGRGFGGLVSGGADGRPPPVPLEFLGMMASVLGPLLDRAWRREKLCQLASVTRDWLINIAGESLADVEWRLGGAAHTGAHDVNVKARDGSHLGSLAVSLAAGVQLSGMKLELVTITAELMQAASYELEELAMTDGDPEWMLDGLRGLEGLSNGSMAARIALPCQLMKCISPSALRPPR